MYLVMTWLSENPQRRLIFLCWVQVATTGVGNPGTHFWKRILKLWGLSAPLLMKWASTDFHSYFWIFFTLQTIQHFYLVFVSNTPVLLHTCVRGTSLTSCISVTHSLFCQNVSHLIKGLTFFLLTIKGDQEFS